MTEVDPTEIRPVPRRPVNERTVGKAVIGFNSYRTGAEILTAVVDLDDVPTGL